MVISEGGLTRVILLNVSSGGGVGFFSIGSLFPPHSVNTVVIFITANNSKLPDEVKVPRDGSAWSFRGLDIRSWAMGKICDCGGLGLLVLKGDGANVNKSIYRHIGAEYRGVGMVQT